LVNKSFYANTGQDDLSKIFHSEKRDEGIDELPSQKKKQLFFLAIALKKRNLPLLYPLKIDFCVLFGNSHLISIFFLKSGK